MAEERPPVSGQWPLVVLMWTLVLIPLGWGIWTTARKAAMLFR